jgi:hypothetical protein
MVGIVTMPLRGLKLPVKLFGLFSKFKSKMHGNVWFYEWIGDNTDTGGNNLVANEVESGRIRFALHIFSVYKLTNLYY